MRQRIPSYIAVVSWVLPALIYGCLILQGVQAAQDAPPPPDAAPPAGDAADTEAPADAKKVVAYRLQHAQSATVIGVLQQLLEQTGGTVSAGTGEKTIVVWGPAETHERVRQLLGEVDVRAEDQSPVLRIYTVRHASPQSLLRVLSEVVPEGRVFVDEGKKALIVLGTKATHERVSQLLEELDVPGPEETRTIRILRLRQADPHSVAETLSGFLHGKDMEISVDQRGRSVIIAASPEVHQIAEELVEQLDRSIEADAVHVMRIFSLKHAQATSLIKLLASVIAEEFPDVRLTPDERLNAILISGSEKALARAGELIQELDVPTARPEARQVKIFRLEHAEADEMVELVANALGAKGTLAADRRTNSILAVGPEEELEAVEAVLQRLDEEAQRGQQQPMPASYQVRIVWLLGPAANEGNPPSEDLKDVVAELAGIGITDVRQVAQTLINTQAGGEFHLRCLPQLGEATVPLTISGCVAQREGTPVLKIQILAEKPAQAGSERVSDGTETLVDLETEIAAPYGHSVVLGVTPVETATSAFVVQIIPTD